MPATVPFSSYFGSREEFEIFTNFVFDTNMAMRWAEDFHKTGNTKSGREFYKYLKNYIPWLDNKMYELRYVLDYATISSSMQAYQKLVEADKVLFADVTVEDFGRNAERLVLFNSKCYDLFTEVINILKHNGVHYWLLDGYYYVKNTDRLTYRHNAHQIGEALDIYTPGVYAPKIGKMIVAHLRKQGLGFYVNSGVKYVHIQYATKPYAHIYNNAIQCDSCSKLTMPWLPRA